MPIQQYTVGFMVDEYGRILLARKNKGWQTGLLNGLGGKIEDGESAYQCMVREFHEETGVAHEDWQPLVMMEGHEEDTLQLWRVYVFRSYVTEFPKGISSTTDAGEAIEVHYTNRLEGERVVPNLRWLVPLVLDPKVCITTGWR